MHTWRITKYNPLLRDNNGNYTIEEWTSYSDIGKYFEGKQLTFNDYIEVENKYINAVLQFMNCLQLQKLEIREQEKYEEDVNNDKNIDYEMSALFKKIEDRTTINIVDVPSLCKLILREHLWGKLEFNPTLYIHFGYDYYMYIGCSKKCETTLEKITASGLYIEQFSSPYLAD